MKEKQLELNLDKTVFIITGRDKQLAKIRKEIEGSPLMINNTVIKETNQEKYLGDIVHKQVQTLYNPRACFAFIMLSLYIKLFSVSMILYFFH